MFGLWDVSTMGFTCVVVTVNLRLLLACNSITRWHYIGVGGSILAWFVFVFIYAGVKKVNSHSSPLFFLPLVHWEKISRHFMTPFKVTLTFSFLLHLPAGSCLSCHLCLDYYGPFLPHTCSSSHCCTHGWLHLPGVRFLRFLIVGNNNMNMLSGAAWANL